MRGWKTREPSCEGESATVISRRKRAIWMLNILTRNLEEAACLLQTSSSQDEILDLGREERRRGEVRRDEFHVSVDVRDQGSRQRISLAHDLR